jgi:hypothetical protein
VGPGDRYGPDPGGRGHHPPVRLILAVGVDNPNARRLYERLGYVDWDHGTIVGTWVERDHDGPPVALSETCHVLVKRLRQAVYYGVESLALLVALTGVAIAHRRLGPAPRPRARRWSGAAVLDSPCPLLEPAHDHDPASPCSPRISPRENGLKSPESGSA